MTFGLKMLKSVIVLIGFLLILFNLGNHSEFAIERYFSPSAVTIE